MRTLATLLCLLFASQRCAAETVTATADDQAKEQQRQQQAEQQYQRQKKSAALAETLEAICPIAGAGVLYAGDADKGTLLMVLSAVAAGAGTGSAFWLIHLRAQHPTGGDRVFGDYEQGVAWTVLVVAGVVYILSRVSGLTLAPDSTAAFNLQLRDRLGLPSETWTVPFHALAPGPVLTFRF